MEGAVFSTPTPGGNPKPNPNPKVHLKKLPLPIIASRPIELRGYERHDVILQYDFSSPTKEMNDP